MKTFLLPAAIFLLLVTSAPAQSSPSPKVSPPPAAARAAAKPADAGRSGREVIMERFRASGITGKIQILVSVFGGTFALERFVRLRRKNISPRGLFTKCQDLWRAGKFTELEALEDTDPSTFARAVSFLTKYRTHPVADLSVTVNDLIAREMDASLQRAYPLGVVATIEPLLGLFGMILGMIESFETVALAGALGNPAQLASGISQALTTTALGIGLAIPFLVLYHYFKNKTNSYALLLEEEVSVLIVEWFMQSKGTSR
ncbi:MAG: MotA/TolQ/ExbB proton channel family protein [Verrucomicrobiae bacterium]